jgi:hypothetical protein
VRTIHLSLIARSISLSTLFGTKEGGKAMVALLKKTNAYFKVFLFNPG